MAAWDGTFDMPFPVDNTSLLEALLAPEARSPNDEVDEIAYLAGIRSRIYKDSEYQILRDNDMLWSALVLFLEADRLVLKMKSEITRFEESFFNRLTRFVFAKEEKKSLEQFLVQLEANRDKLFDKYEMIRRLAAWDNSLLKRYKS